MSVAERLAGTRIGRAATERARADRDGADGPDAGARLAEPLAAPEERAYARSSRARRRSHSDR
jgi:hypothetical protein